ncbi:ABC transporter permease [Parapedobacter sp. ISTM3]|uniref:ABC transporter permease n=1 Tax=Parapedobacter sp. ISTM3 TaxID=2800130 RepID=UPI001904B428|nr:ABC transporter permease [Parapedobacter sp. ISTM3]MBK1439956.1 ABC transporter permease [Parapedobacter sp. ISTM3]
MIKDYLKVAYRSLLKNKLATLINVFGLGLSMSVGLMILIRTMDAFDIDRFHPAPEMTYRINSAYHSRQGDNWKMASSPLPLAGKLGEQADLVDAAVGIYPSLSGKATSDGKELHINGAFTDSSFFSIFGFRLLSGDPATALREPNTILISKNTAERFFGTPDALGKVIAFEHGGEFVVSGVLETPPGKAHFSYDAYASYSSIPAMERQGILPEKSGDWFAFNTAYTYVLLRNKSDATLLDKRLQAVADELNQLNKNGVTSFVRQRLDRISPGRESLGNENAMGTSWTKIYTEAGIALLILFAACFNYTNLTVARALSRAKEVGVRKINGAKRAHIFAQYIVESVMLSFLALGFAWIVLSFIIRYAPFNDDYEFIPSSFYYNIRFVTWSAVYALFAGLVAGSAPAWMLSAFKPLAVLKNLSTARILGRAGIRKALIVFQYSLSLVLIIFLFAFFKQFSFMSAADPGFKREHVLVVPLGELDADITAQRLRGISGVKAVGASSANFTKHFSGMAMPVWKTVKDDAINLSYYDADASFLSLMDFELEAGRGFPEEGGNKERYLLLNGKAAQAFGFANPEDAVGEELWVNDSTQLQVAGVLKDFNYKGSGQQIEPLAFRSRNDAYTNLYVETAGGDTIGVQQRVEAALTDLHGGHPATVSWLSDVLDQRNSQSATLSLLGFIGFIALVVATLGLLGQVTYAVEVKRKEIAIRKVIGADSFRLVSSLSSGFIKVLFVAGLIAMPIGWLLATLFLQNFPIKANFTLLNLLMCLLFLLAAGLFTIVSQTYRAAIAKPVENLRLE